jgi:hypothetical protein
MALSPLAAMTANSCVTVVRDQCKRQIVNGNDSTRLRIARVKLDALNANGEFGNKAHASLKGGYVSATIKVPGKHCPGKNGFTVFAIGKDEPVSPLVS